MSRSRRAMSHQQTGPALGCEGHTIAQPKILKVYVCARVQLSGCLDKAINESIVLLTSGALLTKPEIQFVIEEILIVCTTV